VGFVAAIVYAWGWGVGWLELGLLFGMYVVTGLGVTVGYHRYFTHKSFRVRAGSEGGARRSLGSMAVEGSIMRWAAFHRAHHQHSDGENDPHSPHGHGDGVMGRDQGGVGSAHGVDASDL
jgi:stearoyl-CoA desaturase (delta-9 desaturase)